MDKAEVAELMSNRSRIVVFELIDRSCLIMVVKYGFLWFALLTGGGSTAAQIRATPPSSKPEYSNVSLAFRYALPDGMRDQTERSKLEIQEQTKASGTTEAASVLLSMSSEPDRDATDWGSVTIETYPREEFGNLDEISAETKMSAWVVGASSLPGKPRSVVLAGQNFVVFVAGKQDGSTRKGAVIWTTIRKGKLLSFAFVANSPEQLKRLTESMKSVQFF
jgi:hypothetical protein